MPIDEDLRDAAEWAPSELPPGGIAERALSRERTSRQRRTVGGGVLAALAATALVCLIPPRAPKPPIAAVPVAVALPTPTPSASPRPRVAVSAPPRRAPRPRKHRRPRPLRVARLRERIPVEEPALTAQYEDPDVIVIDQTPNPLEEKPHEL